MTSADLEFRSALESFRRGDHADAEQRLRAATQADPRHAGALNLLGALLASQERFEEAEPILRAAARIPPVAAGTLYNYGLALQTLGRTRDAFAAFEKALTRDPRSADAWFGRGSVLQESGNAEEAIACFDRALAIDPNFLRALANKGTALLRLRRFSESLLTLEACLRLDPNFAPAHLNKAAALYNLRQYGLALAAVETATSLASSVVKGWETRTNICRELGRFDEAIHSIGRALALEPSNREWRETLVDLRLRACEWSHYDSDFAALRADLHAWRRRFRVALPDVAVFLGRTVRGGQVASQRLGTTATQRRAPSAAPGTSPDLLSVRRAAQSCDRKPVCRRDRAARSDPLRDHRPQ
jgi:tetratricopeptide (TPR) repeat protein